MRRVRVAVAGVLLSVVACLDDSATGPEPNGGVLGELVPATAWLEVGATLPLRLTTGGEFQLRSDDPSVVAVSGNGQVRALKPGTTELRAFVLGGRTTAKVTVVPRTPSRRPVVIDSGLTDVSLLGVWAADRSTSYAVGILGVVLRTRDGGDTWERIALGTEDDFVGVWGTGPDDVWVVGEAGSIYHYDGVTWSRQESGTSAPLLEVWGLASDAIYAVGLGVALRYDGVEWHSMPGAEGAELWAVWGPDPTNLFASGQNGVILRWDGTRWRPMTTPTGFILFGLYGRAVDDVYAAGIRGTVLHYDGLAWSPVAVPSGADLFALAGHGNTMVAAGNNGALLTRNGSTWTFTPPFATTENLRAIAFDPDGTMRVAGWSGTVVRRDPSGWRKEISAPILFSSAVGPDGRQIAVGAGAPYRVTGAGTAELVAPTHRVLFGIAVAPNGGLVAVGDTGTVLEFDGATWQVNGVSEAGLLRSIWSDPGDRTVAVIVGEGGRLLTRRGSEWHRLPSPTTRFLRHVHGASRDLIFAVGDSGTILRSEGGRPFESMASPTTARLRGVWTSGASDAHAVGEGGIALRFDGKRWYQVPTPTDIELRAVYGVSPTEVYAVGFGGTLLRFDGASWIGLTTPTTSYLLGLTPGSAGTLVAVGTNRTVMEVR